MVICGDSFALEKGLHLVTDMPHSLKLESVTRLGPCWLSPGKILNEPIVLFLREPLHFFKVGNQNFGQVSLGRMAVFAGRTQSRAKREVRARAPMESCRGQVGLAELGSVPLGRAST